MMNQIVESKEIEMPTPLIFTDNAVKKVKELIEEEGQPELKLRVFVSGGGCSGFQYGFTFEESINEDDTQVTKDSVTLLIDPMSLQYLMGAEIDYQVFSGGKHFTALVMRTSKSCKPSFKEMDSSGSARKASKSMADCASARP